MKLDKILNRELVSRLQQIRADEKRITAELLAYLVEVERRDLHLEMGFASIFVFCTDYLGYSKDEAYVRHQGMRLLSALPEAKDKIESGSLTLSTAAKAQTAFKKENDRRRESGAATLTSSEKRQVLQKLEGESKRDSVQILAETFPEVSFVPERTKPINAQDTLIQFKANRELMAKFEDLKQIYSNSNFDGTWEELFSRLADMALRAAQPKPKLKPNPKVKSKLNTETDRAPVVIEEGKMIPEVVKVSSPSTKFDEGKRRRYISVHIKRELMNHAAKRCEYVDSASGKRCDASHALQVDHVRPLAFGGTDSLENLRILCSAHNRFLARQMQLL